MTDYSGGVRRSLSQSYSHVFTQVPQMSVRTHITGHDPPFLADILAYHICYIHFSCQFVFNFNTDWSKVPGKIRKKSKQKIVGVSMVLYPRQLLKTLHMNHI